MSLAALAQALRTSRGFTHKADVSGVIGALASALPGGSAALGQGVPIGDDTAVLPDGQGGHLLFAIEGLVEDFVARMPWFAGYSAVMVNVSDIYAMGGRPLAVVDALWSDGLESAGQMLAGMAAASAAYGVPIVGGHSNNRSDRGQLAVAILGRAQRLLTSFDARPGDRLVMAVDLRGEYEEPYPFWNASTRAPGQRLRDDLAVLPALAESGLCRAAKDISMAGAIGTALMLLECSCVGAAIDVERIPRPPDADLLRWLLAFPSYGFMLSVAPAQVEAVCARFTGRGIACAAVGTVDAGSRVVLTQGDASALLWDWSEAPFVTAAPEVLRA